MFPHIVVYVCGYTTIGSNNILKNKVIHEKPTINFATHVIIKTTYAAKLTILYTCVTTKKTFRIYKLNYRSKNVIHLLYFLAAKNKNFGKSE